MKTILIAAALASTIAHAQESPLGFDEAIASIVARDPSFLTQEAQEKSVRAANLPTKLFFLPSVDIAAKKGRSKTGVTTTNGRQIEATARWNLFRFGADIAGYKSASAEEDRQKELSNQSLLDAELAAVRALASKISAEQQTAILRKIESAQKQTLKIAKERYDRGLLPAQEMDKLEVDLENSRSRLVDSEIKEAEAKASLHALLGHTNTKSDWAWKSFFAGERVKKVLGRSFRDEDRPSYRAALARLESQTQSYKQRQRLILPSLDFSFSYGRYSDLLYAGTANSINAWTGAFTISLPLFDRLQNFSDARAQSYQRDIAELSLESARRDSLKSAETSQKNFEAALGSALSREKTLGISRKLYDDNLRRFQSGRINANEFSVDQARLYDSELYEVLGWSAAHIAFVELCHAKGLRLAECKE